MNIKILDSWLREYLDTNSKHEKIAEALSLTSVSVDRIEKYADDFLYDLEITTNRPDLASVVGLAREASAVLPHFGVNAKFIPPRLKIPEKINKRLIDIKSDPKIVNRVCAAVLEVKVRESPKIVKERLDSTGIRSLNNLIDITNYVMRTIGHPAHVFDFDRLGTKTLTIRESKRGEKIETLDNKKFDLLGGDIVAVDDSGKIVDLLGVMGLANTVVTNNSKRILFFIDNNEPYHIRKTSMSLGLRTEAATLNEKGLDPQLAFDALLLGIKLYEELADGKLISDILDIYPNKPQKKLIEVNEQKINSVIGIEIPIRRSLQILENLGFKNQISGNVLKVEVPSFRLNDINEDVDLIEEIARVYGYHNIPSSTTSFNSATISSYANEFFWEKRTKDCLKYWGFTETYTNSMVSQVLFEGDPSAALEIQNPLNSDLVFMRRTLVPSLLQVARENKKYDFKIFEIANVYIKKSNDLPLEILTLAGIVKKTNVSFYEVKGVIEQLFNDLGIKKVTFKKSQNVFGASIFVDKEDVGEIEVLDNDIIDFEINFEKIINYATLKKIYKPINQFPPVIEDLSFVLSEDIQTQDLIEEIKAQSLLIVDVSLLDKYETSRTFHIIYQDASKNLTTKETSKIREKIIKAIKDKFQAKLK